MYCRYCGTKNPDGARFCNNCGNSMNDNSGKQSTTARKNNGGKKSGFFSRLLVGVLVFAVTYAVSYVINSSGGKDKGSIVKPEITIDPPAIAAVTTPKEDPMASSQNDDGYIAYLDGYWEEVQLKDGSFNLDVSAMTFRQTVYNCTGFTVNMEVQMNAGTNCKDWQVWGRCGNNYVKLAKIYLPAGDGYVSQRVTFANPVTFDSIAITPTIVGSYSWSMSLGISDVWTK